MKKEYTKPTAEIIDFGPEDAIMAYGDGGADTGLSGGMDMDDNIFG